MKAGRRRIALALLVLAVALVHGLLADRIAQELPDLQHPPIDRLQAAFVRELQPAEPLTPAPPAPAPVPIPRPRPAAPPPAASAPEPAASAPQDTPEPPIRAAVDPEPAPPAMAGAEGEADRIDPAAEPRDTARDAARDTAAPGLLGAMPAGRPGGTPPSGPPGLTATSGQTTEAAAGPAAALTPGAAPFEWPLSTRLSYTLTGNVRGEVSGRAQVEWLREGDRYQVRVEVILGPSFAPLMQRRMTSDGRITAQGLSPLRYEEETQIAFAAPRRAGVVFDAEGVTLANGQRQTRLPGLQDTASQFVQLTWLFATGAEPLHAGGEVVVPLALPRRLDRWVYDVVGEESLATPFGSLPTWHLRPRREGTPSVLSIETWFAPRLQYLPVRIVIRQGPDSFIEMMIERLPQQAAAPAPGPP